MKQVSKPEMNTDEPLVEVSLVGNTVSERMSYMGFLISACSAGRSAATVNRSWQHDTRDKGGMTGIQALQCNRGEPTVAGKKHQGGITIKTIILVPILREM